VRSGPAGRLAGIARTRAQCAGHSAYWRAAAATAAGPRWVVLGDSGAQGIGAADPRDGYVGRVLAELAGRGDRWHVVNLSTAGALTADVLAEQLPRLARLVPAPALVSCGVGGNDVLRTPPHRLRRQWDELAARLPPGAVLLTLPAGVRGIGRRYARWLNAGIRAAAARHGHRVADVEAAFTPPWQGKFSADGFHPSALGYADWAAAVLAALGPPPAAQPSTGVPA
jgi:lysophospholipase L1-like esterase